MKYQLTIPYRFPSLNEYIAALGKNPRTGGKMKKNDCEIMIFHIRQQLKGIKIKKPVVIHYTFYEKNTKRDRMNVFSYADKVFEDALQKAGTINNDGWNDVLNTTHDFYVDKTNPRIEIVIEEV